MYIFPTFPKVNSRISLNIVPRWGTSRGSMVMGSKACRRTGAGDQGLSHLTVWDFTTEQVKDLEAIKYLIKKDALAMAEMQLSTLPGLTSGYCLWNWRGREDLWIWGHTDRHWPRNKDRAHTWVWHSLSCSAGNQATGMKGQLGLKDSKDEEVWGQMTRRFQFICLKNLFPRCWECSVLLLPQLHTQQQLVTGHGSPCNWVWGWTWGKQ